MYHDNIAMIAVAGIIATAMMNTFVYIVSVLAKEQLNVIRVLGTMLTRETRVNKKLSRSSRSYFTGLIVHYSIGCLFSFVYDILYGGSVADYSMTNTLLFGFVIGSVAYIVWKLFFYLHPDPPRIFLTDYTATIFAGHFIFSMGLLLIYTSKPFF